jgi:hypothetical protein
MISLAQKSYSSASAIGVVAACSSLIFAHAPAAQAGCTFLTPIGGNGDGPKPYIVKKQVERPKGLIGKAVGRTNWNTDFVVNQPFGSYKLFFTADSTDSNPGSYPIEAFLKFSDGSNLKVVNEFMKPPTGTGAQFGPFQAPSGKAVSQVNFRIGANNDPGATGFSYRISVQGCD